MLVRRVLIDPEPQGLEYGIHAERHKVDCDDLDNIIAPSPTCPRLLDGFERSTRCRTVACEAFLGKLQEERFGCRNTALAPMASDEIAVLVGENGVGKAERL